MLIVGKISTWMQLAWSKGVNELKYSWFKENEINKIACDQLEVTKRATGGESQVLRPKCNI